MTSKTNAARVAVKAAACLDTSSDTASLDTTRADSMPGTADHDEQPLDIHDAYRQHKSCGFTRDLPLTEWEAQAINARLYGLSAISALLIGSDDDESFKLGAWIKGGLHNALCALAEDAQDVLHRANVKAANAEKGSAA
ncbi:hypothetical protein [Comamonas sp.]|uniref:hypothetical protein n=1 Tax=Comamonas sp. TaxID=34028 RepID=UPI00289940B2|nr:hypothetical protein [Comamonas sp.]